MMVPDFGGLFVVFMSFLRLSVKGGLMTIAEAKVVELWPGGFRCRILDGTYSGRIFLCYSEDKKEAELGKDGRYSFRELRGKLPQDPERDEIILLELPPYCNPKDDFEGGGFGRLFWANKQLLTERRGRGEVHNPAYVRGSTPPRLMTRSARY